MTLPNPPDLPGKSTQTSSLTPAFGYNPRAGRYVDLTSGRFVPFQAVRAELEQMVDHAALSLRALSAQFQARTLTLAEWQLGMVRELKVLHVAAAAAGRGGWAQMNPSDWGWVGARLRAQYAYLANFAAQIESGAQKLDGRFLNRTTQYARAARATYEDMRLRREQLTGTRREGRRILHARESCSGCVSEAGRGWVALTEMAPIGVFECRHNCRCTLEFR